MTKLKLFLVCIFCLGLAAACSSTKAKIMGAYAYYKDQKYDDAILSLDRFIKFHPGNKDIAYAYYLKALCYYEQITGVEKDQENTRLALQALRPLPEHRICQRRVA